MEAATTPASPALHNAAVAAVLLAERAGLADRAALDAICGAGSAQALIDAGLAESHGAALALAGDADFEPDAERRSALHAAAASYYVDLIDDPSAEAAYLHHLTRRCEALISGSPADLADTVAGAPLDRLRDTGARDLLRYYAALGLGLSEQIAPARAALAALLAEPALPDSVRGRALNSAAVFARQQGDYEAALAGYGESQALWERLHDATRAGMALLNRGVMRYELHEYAAAEEDMLAALARFEQADAPARVASAHNELGLVYRDQGRWTEAQQHFALSEALWQGQGASAWLGISALNQGELALLMGRYGDAKALLARAQPLLDEQIYAVDVLVNQGLLAQAQGDEGGALQHYGRALALSERAGYGERLALIHARIGQSRARLGDTPAARAAYAEAVASVEARRTPLRNEGLLLSLMGRWQGVYEALVLQCLAAGDDDAAFEATERARARAFADLLAQRRTADGRSQPADGGDNSGTSALGTQHSALSAQRLQTALPPGGLFLSYFAAGLRGPEQALLDQLPPEAAALRECLDTPAQLLVFAVTPGGVRAVRCAIDPNLLAATSARRADGRRFLAPPILRQLYDALVAPVADLLAAAAEVFVAPHGPLHQLPFATLLDEAGRPLVECAPPISYTPSATIWLQQRAAPVSAAPRAPMLAVGYDGAGADRLRHTEAEARAVAARCGGEAWRGEEGVLARLMERAGGYRLLHLACHGTFNGADPLRSALEIGPGEQLSAAAVLQRLRLRADLVTLSACRSGVSAVLRGDEPLGLVRAFLGAGARAVLVTLWPVEDASARLLMERLYQALLEDPQRSPGAALQAAQRWLRALTPDQLARLIPGAPALQCADPAIWAAYVVIG
jgi:tetratricopeptide (TPR) repeat protein